MHGSRGERWGEPWAQGGFSGRGFGPGPFDPGFGPFGPGPFGPPWAGRRRGPFGPGGRGPKARKGNVRAAVLALLAEGPRNGYQIIQDVEERSGGGWRPSPGAVYPALQQLADEGLIIGEDGAGRRTFRLTDEGRAYVEANPGEVTEPWAAMTPEYGEGVPELFKQAAQTGAAVMQIVHSGSAAHVEQATRILADARRGLYRLLADDEPDAPADEE
ncbi:PadR family transcriptional regulator [Actinomadura parmotrematis]|uniref:PadR family transcriptional regulator n=1 Tax=Actinomadura parmotrematis TaxID=2864039 RepID=A0ABS7FPY8_9ACTN|nr:PadR family transcriptional regulator [Actinomadura parmotrematis]MBW8482290.1 PadR family transcriptional regulator [Actinomadura parmotrematis]